MKKLIKGLHKFQNNIFPRKKAFFENLAHGQEPEVLFITCSDSRINPHLVTSAEPGDLFITRNCGNIIPSYGYSSEWATIEFAIYGLKIKHIIICGHSHCGAIQFAINQQKSENKPILSQWVKENIEPTLKLVKENYKDSSETSLINLLTQENVLKQVENLKSNPEINLKLLNGEIILHAWVYQLETGEIFSYDPLDGQFKPLSSL